MKSIVRLPKRNPRYWKRCKNGASPFWEQRTSFPRHSLSWRRKIPSSWRELILSRRPSSTVFFSNWKSRRNSAATLEQIVNQRELGIEPDVHTIIDVDTLKSIMETVRRIYLPEVVANYIARVVDATHPGQSQSSASIKFGSSPRAALSMASAAKARAVVQGRTNASFEDVKAVAPPVLLHRIILDYTARIDGRTNQGVIESLLSEVPFQAETSPRTVSA